jgi:hypothetical protein
MDMHTYCLLFASYGHHGRNYEHRREVTARSAEAAIRMIERQNPEWFFVGHYAPATPIRATV